LGKLDDVRPESPDSPPVKTGCAEDQGSIADGADRNPGGQRGTGLAQSGDFVRRESRIRSVHVPLSFRAAG
jgi:hypothetical protein